MNQILLTDKFNNKDGNKGKNKKDTSKNNSNDIKKIITFFSVVILVFGVAIGGIYGYKLLKNDNDEADVGPKLQIIKDEEIAEQAMIIAESGVGIRQIVYSWNDGEEVKKEFDGSRKKQEETIEIPYGDNTLKIKMVDINGIEREIIETFSREQPLIEDSDKIQISIAIAQENGVKKVKITAKSENPIEYMTYRWNDEEEIKIDAVAEEEEFVLETAIDVRRGINTLTVAAKDIENNFNSTEKNFDGRLKPEFKVVKRGNKLYMKVTHDKGFKSIEFSLNEKTYKYDENFAGYDSEKQKIEFSFNLEEGENIVIIKAISTEETEKTYKGKCNYTAE